MSARSPDPLIVVPAPLELSTSDASTLLRLAFTTLRRVVEGGSAPGLGLRESSGALAEPVRVFVTITEGDELRGCIGLVEAVRPLGEATRDMVVASATRDPRFCPLQPEELSTVKLEISVLGPFVEARASLRRGGAGFVTPGVHGLYLRREGASGLLLPQVASKFGWDAEEFLRQTALKAGLEESAWSDPAASLWLFRARRVSGQARDYLEGGFEQRG